MNCYRCCQSKKKWNQTKISFLLSVGFCYSWVLHSLIQLYMSFTDYELIHRWYPKKLPLCVWFWLKPNDFNMLSTSMMIVIHTIFSKQHFPIKFYFFVLQKQSLKVKSTSVVRNIKWYQSDIKLTSKWHQRDIKLTLKWHQSDITVTSKCSETRLRQTFFFVHATTHKQQQQHIV